MYICPLLAASRLCISNCFAFRLSSSLASCSLFYFPHLLAHTRMYFKEMHHLTGTYSCNDFLNLLFVTFHFNNALDLAKVDIFSVSFRNDFIKCAKKFECIFQDLPLVAGSASVSNNTSKQMKRFNVLQDVGLSH
jgi:hypothetical protein